MKIDKNTLKKLIIKEIAMMSISPMANNMRGPCMRCGAPVCTCNDYSDSCNSCGSDPCCCTENSMSYTNQMSKEACCIAIKAIAECCECPETRSAFLSLCDKV